MINEVYNRRIIELAASIPRIGRLAAPDATAKAVSRLCGSTVTVDLKMDGDRVTDFAHEVKACALGQASSSIMAHHVVGSNADELRALRETVRKMLKENGEPPRDGKWADIAVLEPVRDYKARHASTLLTFDAVVDAIGQIETRRSAKNTRDDRGGITFTAASDDLFRHPEVRAQRASKGDGQGRAASFEARLRRAPQDDGSTSNGTGIACLRPPRLGVTRLAYSAAA